MIEFHTNIIGYATILILVQRYNNNTDLINENNKLLIKHTYSFSFRFFPFNSGNSLPFIFYHLHHPSPPIGRISVTILSKSVQSSIDQDPDQDPDSDPDPDPIQDQDRDQAVDCFPVQHCH